VLFPCCFQIRLRQKRPLEVQSTCPTTSAEPEQNRLSVRRIPFLSTSKPGSPTAYSSTQVSHSGIQCNFGIFFVFSLKFWGIALDISQPFPASTMKFHVERSLFDGLQESIPPLLLHLRRLFILLLLHFTLLI
jgi:hypothetical protein